MSKHPEDGQDWFDHILECEPCSDSEWKTPNTWVIADFAGRTEPCPSVSVSGSWDELR